MSSSDDRSVRDIMLAVERKLDAQLKASNSTGRTLFYPKKPTKKCAEAMKMVLDDWKERHQHGSFTAFIEAVNDIEPGCFGKSGHDNDVIRSFCAELMGIDVRWAGPSEE